MSCVYFILFPENDTLSWRIEPLLTLLDGTKRMRLIREPEDAIWNGYSRERLFATLTCMDTKFCDCMREEIPYKIFFFTKSRNI